MSRWISLASFTSAPEAHIAKGLLENEGIPAQLRNESLVGVHWLYSHAVGGVQLYVPGELARQAQDILEKVFTADAPDLPDQDQHADLNAAPQETAAPRENDPPPCPRCGSRESEQHRSGLMAALSLYFQIPLPFARRYRRCTRCGATWR